MLKKQEKVLHWMLTNFRASDPRRELLCKPYYTDKYLYATDSYSIIRAANETGSKTTDNPGYPLHSLEKFLDVDLSKRKTFRIDTDVQDRREVDGMKVCRYGEYWYQEKYIKKFIEFFGKDAYGFEGNERYEGLYIQSPKGDGLILPIRL